MVAALDHSKPKNCKICGILKNPEEFRQACKPKINGVIRRKAECTECSRKKERLSDTERIYRNCVVCSEKFEQHGRKITCSKKCYFANKRVKKVERNEKTWEKDSKIFTNEPANLRKVSRRNAVLKNKYGITTEVYYDLLKKQDYVCDICKKPETAKDSYSKETKNLAVDHNHETGEVRGLLCSACNRGLGYFKEDIFSLDQAIAYLKKFGKENE